MVQLKLVPAITKNLFSRHYLDERLKTLPIWTEDNGKSERVFGEIKKLYEKDKSLLPNYEEAQLEENFIKPVLRILGHVFEVQQPSDRSPLKPDYAFFPDEESKREAQKNKGKGEFYKKAIAIGDAKKWGTPLDRKSKGRALYEFNNPSFQIDIYLRDTGVAWGVLTDGKFWRLYYKEKNPVESYYEVDLAEILESGSNTDFKYFYLFFRKETFLKDASGKNFLEKVYSEGVDYAEKVSEDLEKNVYGALKILAQGFLAWQANNLKPTEETVKKIHENSLIFLYRLLFILYANSRGMLKTYKPGYEYYDITKIKVTAFNKKQDGSASEHSSELWIRLRELFKLIDEGSESRKIPKEELYVPPYNGGLFKQDGDYKFLSENSVGDKYVADVLHLLTFSEEEDSKGFIDYSTLEIRHLGSIYEGLLEYKLKIAEENLAAVKEKDKQVWIPENKANGKKILDEAKKDELYLATDKGERKATGSYYTPDYIVKYIVGNTLSPIVEEKLKGAATDEEKIERILSIKVLDPAMGSGHFLVDATNFLANKIVPFIPPEKLKEEKEIEWAKREVVKRCIYGVDLNPLATELAKLSLWLATISEERPLSFLDYHLKVGNSLIGADLQKLSKHPLEVKEATAPTFLSDFMDKEVHDKIKTLVNMHTWIAERAQETIQDIKNIEDVFKQFETNPFRQAFVELANLHTSYWLGNKFSKEEYYEALAAFRQFSKDRSKWEKVKEKEYFKKAQDIAREKNFFQWHLEFPGVFFETGKGKEDPGFDVIVGNPPYGAELDKHDREYIEIIYPYSRENKNTAMIFMELSAGLLNEKGFFGMIVPKSLAFSQKWKKGRDMILPSLLVLTDASKAFEDVLLEQVIVVFPNLDRISENYITSVFDDEKEQPRTIIDKAFCKSTDTLLVGVRDKEAIIFQKMTASKRFMRDISTTSRGLPLQRYVNNKGGTKVYRGDHIARYTLFESGDYLDDKSIDRAASKVKFIRQPKIISQRIVAHVLEPTDHIILMATEDRRGILTFDTVENTVLTDDNFNLSFISALFNSTLISWYAYRFIFNKAIRTMDFDKYYIEKIPLPNIRFTTPIEKRKKMVERGKNIYKKVLQQVESSLEASS